MVNTADFSCIISATSGHISASESEYLADMDVMGLNSVVFFQCGESLFPLVAGDFCGNAKYARATFACIASFIQLILFAPSL